MRSFVRPMRALPILMLGLLLPVSGQAAIEIQRVISPGGIEAWLVEDHSIPILAVEIAFRGGNAVDPGGKEGLTEMAASTMDEGAGELDSQAFQRRLEDLSVGLGFRAGRDNFGGHLKTLTKNRAAAFELLRLALTGPRFDTEPVERIRSQLQAVLARDAEDPETIAGRDFARAVFDEHPYGRAPKGTPESIAAITPQDLRDFVGRHIARGNLVLGVTGDITADELRPLLDSTFGALPAKARIEAVPEAELIAEGTVRIVEKDIPQSVIVFGHRGFKREDPDYIAAYVMNYIFGGGGFNSRLMEEVRRKRGLAYSVYTYLNPMDRGALFLGGVSTQNSRAGQSIEVIRAEWARMAEAGPTEEELQHAKTYLTGSYALRFTTTNRISRILVGLQLDHLGIDYIKNRNAMIEAVTLDEVRRVAKRLLDPEALSFTVVGKPEGVTATN